eukprot:TRINITY_DN4719_c0_g1_i1.p1 TRINITY_DN4719_c0_g1~~TRINITY_DN4719_c0_g1_i1.p1  ORF type:complete len:381 (-),score=84.35 TRINITY_DN4719_c0_g1_i1:82-1128(-)
MPSGFDYSKWDKIELSDDEDDLHPNIDKDSWFRLKHRTRVEREEDEEKERVAMVKKLDKLKNDLSVYGEAGKEHTKAKKLAAEIAEIEAKLEKMEREKKLNADNMCKTAESRTEVNSSAGRADPKPEPRLRGEEMAAGYCEFVEKHEELLESYIAMGDEDDLEKVGEFLKENGGTLLVGEHAESYLLLDCLEKEMNGQHAEMKKSARQHQLLTQLREFSRASHRPVMDAVHPIFSRLVDHDETRQAFDDAVRDFVKRCQKRAVEKKKEMDAEEEANMNESGPGGLNPIEVLNTLPEEMQIAFRTKDIQRLQCAIEALPEEEAKYHLQRCEESGLWVPSAAEGPPPYRQ